MAYGKKWVGPAWGAIGADLIMKIKPTKTEDTSEVEVIFDLAACPMVLEELRLIPEEQRKGPLVVNSNTGLPYAYETFRAHWKDDFKPAGLPKHMWCRDIRAGGATEARASGASKDDLRQVMGHTDEEQTDTYDRAKVEAFRRVMKARTDGRKNSP